MAPWLERVEQASSLTLESLTEEIYNRYEAGEFEFDSEVTDEEKLARYVSEIESYQASPIGSIEATLQWLVQLPRDDDEEKTYVLEHFVKQLGQRLKKRKGQLSNFREKCSNTDEFDRENEWSRLVDTLSIDTMNALKDWD